MSADADPSAPPARVVVVLFADLVGSTRAFAALAPAAAEQVRRQHLRRMIGAVETAGGSPVKTLGDGVMVTFASATAAVRGAVAVQRALGGREAASCLPVRVGVSAGDATPEAGDWHGRPVVEASRLCAAAAPGEVLCAEHVLRLAGVDTDADAVRELQLKGLSAPLPAVAVDWAAGAAPPLRAVIADDSALVLEGLARVLETRGIEVVARCVAGDDLVRAVDALRPDVVVTDVRMPPHDLAGLEAAEDVLARHAGTGVLLLSTRVERRVARRLLAASRTGVGYLSKDRIGHVEDLIAAVGSVAAGGRVLDPALPATVQG